MFGRLPRITVKDALRHRLGSKSAPSAEFETKAISGEAETSDVTPTVGKEGYQPHRPGNNPVPMLRLASCGVYFGTRLKMLLIVIAKSLLKENSHGLPRQGACYWKHASIRRAPLDILRQHFSNWRQHWRRSRCRC
jgi:hypothetical protein